MTTATGPFTVTLTPEPAIQPEGRALHIEKRYTGALDATATGTMLAAHGHTKGSAGYVAMETVTGTLDGYTGSFTLQHSGTMQDGEESLTITIVPDSGTDALATIAGHLTITRDSSGHMYRLDYTI